MATKKDRVTINEYKSLKRRKNPGQTVSIRVKSEPLVHTFDEDELARGPAEAIRDVVADQIRAIDENAAQSTIAKRRREGRTGTRLFNDSGKLADELKVVKSGDTFETRVGPSRLTGATRDLVSRLFELVKIGSRDLMKDKTVREEVAKGKRKIISKGRKR